MIQLHQYPPIWNLPSLSPFCIKVESFLRLKELPYKTIIESNPKKGPKGKMPFIVHNDLVIPDSSFIVNYLTATYGGFNDHQLTTQEEAISQAFQSLIEDKLYFVILYSRWIDQEGFRITRNAFKSLFPIGTGNLALSLIKNSLKRQAYAQGMGRHSKKEIYALGNESLEAISKYLGAKIYFFGEDITSIDTVVYAFLLTIMNHPQDNPLKQYLSSSQNLVAYTQRMTQIIFPEDAANRHTQPKHSPELKNSNDSRAYYANAEN